MRTNLIVFPLLLLLLSQVSTSEAAKRQKSGSKGPTLDSDDYYAVLGLSKSAKVRFNVCMHVCIYYMIDLFIFKYIYYIRRRTLRVLIASLP